MKYRDFAEIELNGRPLQIRGKDLLLTLAEYLRERRGLPGTKIVCAEGDCGACTVLVKSHREEDFKSINSCIALMFTLDGQQVVSVEGIKEADKLHPVQESMVNEQGAQCGYCTPGFIMSMVELYDKNSTNLDEQKIKNALTGNLCRCTGYEPIIKAAKKWQPNHEPLKSRYQSLLEENKHSLKVEVDGLEIYLPQSFDEACEAVKSKSYKIVSGLTDLGVLRNKGKLEPQNLMGLHLIPEAYDVIEEDGEFVIGARASLTEVEKKLEPIYPELSRLLHIFASPQIKNAGTLIGNILNASPIGDSIPFAMATQCKLIMKSTSSSREVALTDLYKGYKDLDMKTDEICIGLKLPKIKNDKIKLYKVSVRKDLDISIVTLAIRVNEEKGKIKDINIIYGGVGPVVKKCVGLEKMAKNRIIDQSLRDDLVQDIKNHIAPISDHRASKEYRILVSENLMRKFFAEEYNI